jgi:hypothetical protein
MVLKSPSVSALVFSVLVLSAACGDDSSDDDATGGRVGSGGQASGGSAGKGATGGRAASGGAPNAGAGSGGITSGGSATGGSAGSDAGSTSGGAGAGEAGGPGQGEAGAPGEGGNGGGDPGGEGGTGEGGDGGFAGVPQEPEEEALLDRPPGDQYDCTVTRDLELLDLDWRQSTVLAGESPSLVYSKELPSELVWSTLGIDGELGVPNVVHAAENNWLSYLTAARGADRTTIVWAESGTEPLTKLQLAQVDADGDVVTAAHPLVESTFEQSQPKLISAGDGYALLWSEQLDEQATLKFARLDATGALVGTPKTLVQGTTIYAGTLLAAGSSFAATYSEFTDKYRTHYLALDAEGEPHRAPVLLGSDFITNASLLSRGERVLAAWTVFSGGFENQNISLNVRIGWFDRRGNPVGATYDLQKPVVHEENVEPSWVEFGDDLGLVWAKGGVIYVCAGCIPDNHLEFVVLDGESLSPISNVVRLDNSETNGGLRRPEVVVSGSDLLLIPSITYHVSAEGGTATLRCEE